ncbi:hemerythrin domain-containing protein [Sphingomonas aracearum]|uniref:Hemerythrin domain-containing protein n=1 Tax=Sphingomonas aracearum TaxID=2283317 RepID=A0A369VZ38_9SPHN|nr:hemerythrin domain-containing protein [Sphingomonas aracearum]RDE05081.1 hemerythrin domain-containing protein [Sphingomonas aracearum]
MATTSTRSRSGANRSTSKSATTDRTQDKPVSSNGDRGLSNFTVVAGAAGAGMALGVLAMLGRKVAVQAPTYFAGEWDQALAAEHKAVLKLFDALQATEDSETSKRSVLLTQMKHALAKHALEEENAVYPALRDAGEIAGADELNSEHGYVKQYLYDLENMPNNSPEFLVKVAKFRADIEEHMQEEEEALFPLLRSKLTAEQNKLLTQQMNKEGFKLA